MTEVDYEEMRSYQDSIYSIDGQLQLNEEPQKDASGKLSFVKITPERRLALLDILADLKELKAKVADNSALVELIFAKIEEIGSMPLPQGEGQLWKKRKEQLLEMENEDLRNLLTSLEDEETYKSCMEKVVSAISKFQIDLDK
jgi:DNA repair ATPase RecN